MCVTVDTKGAVNEIMRPSGLAALWAHGFHRAKKYHLLLTPCVSFSTRMNRFPRQVIKVSTISWMHYERTQPAGIKCNSLLILTWPTVFAQITDFASILLYTLFRSRLPWVSSPISQSPFTTLFGFCGCQPSLPSSLVFSTPRCGSSGGVASPLQRMYSSTGVVTMWE